MYAAEILADSVTEAGHRLTTFQITFPRIVLAEFNTHRVFSRNSASSRAIPVDKRIEAILESPFVPAAFGSAKRGMQAGDDLGDRDQEDCRKVWLSARDAMVEHARQLVQIGVHKQWANRLLEPFAWHTVIVTATEWANYWALRVSEMAQPEIFTVSEKMKELFDASEPEPLGRGDWHLPLVGRRYGDDFDGFGDPETPGVKSAAPPPDVLQARVRLSVARCARVSYLTHEGIRDPSADQTLYERLTTNGHMSPTEHAARPMWPGELNSNVWCGNFRGWVQHRKELPGEAVFVGDDA